MKKAIILMLAMVMSVALCARPTTCSIADFISQKPATAVTLNEVTVYHCDSNFLFISDRTGRLCIVSQSTKFDFKNGDVLQNVTGTYDELKGNPRMKAASLPAAPSSTVQPIEPDLRNDMPSADDLYALVEYQGQMIWTKGAERNYLFGMDSLRLYDMFGLGTTYDEESCYKIRAIVVHYDARTLCLAPFKVTQCMPVPEDEYNDLSQYDYVVLDSVVHLTCDSMFLEEAFRYDSLGNCIYQRYRRYGALGEEPQIVEYYYTNEYDADSRVIRRQGESLCEGTRSAINPTYFAYDAEGRMISRMIISEPNDTIYGIEYIYTDSCRIEKAWGDRYAYRFYYDAEGRIRSCDMKYDSKPNAQKVYDVTFIPNEMMVSLFVEEEFTINFEVDYNIPMTRAKGYTECKTLNDDLLFEPVYRPFTMHMEDLEDTYVFYWSGRMEEKTGVADINDNHNDNCRKLFRDGQLIITRGGAKYSALGHEIK